MSSYRFLSPAEEEMTEAALFYESRSDDSEVISSTMYNEQSIEWLIILTQVS